jgi:hypothetical protein
MREELIMLTAAELDIENCRPIDFPQLRRVYAWSRYPSGGARAESPGPGDPDARPALHHEGVGSVRAQVVRGRAPIGALAQ